MAITGIACETITSGSAQRRQPAEAANTMARAAPRIRPSSSPRTISLAVQAASASRRSERATSTASTRDGGGRM
jgi:hypothetical protein